MVGRVPSEPGAIAFGDGAQEVSAHSGDAPSRDDEIDFYDEEEGAEWCDRCQGLGTADCHCGGDQCYCENNGEMECPTCHGEGRWTPTPGQLAARAETARWWRELNEGLARDSDRSGEAGETGTGSTEGESAGRRHRPAPVATPHSIDQLHGESLNAKGARDHG